MLEKAKVIENLNLLSIEGDVCLGGTMNVLILEDNKEKLIELPSSINYKTENTLTTLKKNFEQIGKQFVSIKNDHPNHSDLSIYKYSKKVFYSHSWGTLDLELNNTLELARGIVLDSLGYVVSFPFEKVFNYGEIIGDESTGLNHNKLNDGDYQFIEKFNGFLGVISAGHLEDDLLIHTQGSLNYEGNPYIRYIEDVLTPSQRGKVINFFKNKGKHTLMFEVIHPSDPHIVKYEDGEYGLKLIGCRNIENIEFDKIDSNLAETYKLFTEKELDELAEDLGFDRPKHFIEKLSNVLEDLKTLKNLEGFMIRDIDTNKHIVKLKTPFYLITKFLSRMNEGNYNYLYSNKDKFISDKGIDEEFFPIVDYIYENKELFKTLSKEEKLEKIQEFVLTSY